MIKILVYWLTTAILSSWEELWQKGDKMNKKQLICMWIAIAVFMWMGIAARISLPQSIFDNYSYGLIRFIIHFLPVLAMTIGLSITFPGKSDNNKIGRAHV